MRPELELPGWYLVAGCLYQTVWNVVTGQPPEAGILDYDLAYFDDTDLSWDAEDAVIQAGHEVFTGLPVPVQIRNQARVHLWYEQKFGIPCPPHDSTEAAIDTYEATTACLGVRQQPDGRWRIYALVVRPNPGRAPGSLRGQDGPVAPAMAGAHGPALAGTGRASGPTHTGTATAKDRPWSRPRTTTGPPCRIPDHPVQRGAASGLSLIVILRSRDTCRIDT